jgi:hypothetical protein
MVSFAQVQGGRESLPQEYMWYFEDQDLSPTQRLGKRGGFSKVSIHPDEDSF